ncbi:hypothetical protein [Xanthobacter pseudotagetidis]|uniref:hypothetical protein n=1 Tax=Xanthobacter pseudotagetidis TaxID=3119911 RepID=UPI00372A1516
MTSHEGAPRAVPGLPSFCALLCAALWWCGAQPAGAADETGPRSVTLTFLNAPAEAEPLLRPPTLGLAVGSGEVHRAVLDTGSTGVVISASSILDLDNLPVIGPGQLTYTSSGRIMQGRYVFSPVTVIGKNGVALTTRPIAVLAVDSVDCLVSARNCEPQDQPRGIAMLGIGFARERDHQRAATPDKNPFLNLPDMGQNGRRGPLGRGYVLNRRQVQVGLEPGDIGVRFATIPLLRDPASGDWAPPQACISVAQRMPPACGTLLVDTGVTSMYLSIPVLQIEDREHISARGLPTIAVGVELAILPPPGASAPSYRFVVGDDANPLAPEQVILVGDGRRPPFVNTTVRLLNRYDYAFDADAGLIGFRPVQN